MIKIRGRRSVTAAVMAGAMLATTALPNTPLTAPVAQAAEKSNYMGFECHFFAGNGLYKDTAQIYGNLNVNMPDEVEVDEVFDLTIAPETMSFTASSLAPGYDPTFEQGNTTNNKVRFEIGGDVELVNAPANVTLNNGILEIQGMMKPRSQKGSETVYVDFTPTTIQLKAKSSGVVTLSTTDPVDLQASGGIRNRSMVYGEGKVSTGDLFFPNAGIRLNCNALNDTELNRTLVDPISGNQEPTYAAVEVEQGATEQSAAINGLTVPATYSATTGTPAWATVNADGTVSLAPGVGVAARDYTVPVLVTYSDGSTDVAQLPVTVTAIPEETETEADLNDPKFPAELNVPAGGSASTAAPTGIADGATVALGDSAPGWASIDENGVVTVRPSAGVAPGEYEVPVVVTYSDGSEDAVVITVTVGEQAEDEILSSLEQGSLTLELSSERSSGSVEGLAPYVLGGLGIFALIAAIVGGIGWAIGQNNR